MYYVVMFAEDELHEVVPRDSLEAAHAYASGFMAGGCAYGAGSCAAYVYPEDAEEMQLGEDPEEVRAALTAINKIRENGNG